MSQQVFREEAEISKIIFEQPINNHHKILHITKIRHATAVTNRKSPLKPSPRSRNKICDYRY